MIRRAIACLSVSILLSGCGATGQAMEDGFAKANAFVDPGALG
jgi:hypothetical protein